MSFSNRIKNVYFIYTSEGFTKKVSHFILLVISTLFSINMFWNLASVLVYQIVWAAFAIALELMKVNIFMRVKYKVMNLKLKNLISLVPITIMFIAYLASATISGVATLGFAMTSIEQQSFETRNLNLATDTSLLAIKDIEDELRIVSSSIDNLLSEQRKMNEMSAVYHTGQDKMNTAIQELLNRRESLRERRQDLSQEVSSQNQNYNIVSENIFSLIGSTPRVNMSGRDVIFRIFVALVVLLELLLVLTSGMTHPDKTIDINRNLKFRRYIEALYDVTGNRLNSDKKISEKTKLTMKECKKFRKMLSTKKFGDNHLLEYGRGFSKSTFTKEEVLKLIEVVF